MPRELERREVAGEEDHAVALRERGFEVLAAFDADRRELAAEPGDADFADGDRCVLEAAACELEPRPRVELREADLEIADDDKRLPGKRCQTARPIHRWMTMATCHGSAAVSRNQPTNSQVSQ